jgi:hypothetical protein
MYNDIRCIDAGQDEYRKQHGSYSKPFNDVTNFFNHSLDYEAYIRADSQQWFCSVLAQGRFPGNFLFMGGERIVKVYFNTNAPATTNDMVICEF